MTLPRYKEIVNLIKQGETAEAQKLILELREAAIEIQEENAELKEKVQRLEGELKGRLAFEKGVYYLAEGKTREGPYCQRCYDKDAKLVRLQDDGDHWFCYGCSHGYPKEPYTRPV